MAESKGASMGAQTRRCRTTLTFVVLAGCAACSGGSSTASLTTRSQATTQATTAPSTTAAPNASSSSTTAAPNASPSGITGADAVLTGALSGHLILTTKVACGDSKDGITATAVGTVSGTTYTLAIQVFSKPSSPEEIDFPAAAAVVRIFDVGSDGRVKDSWAAGRPAVGKGKLNVATLAPLSYTFDTDLWHVDANGVAAESAATNVHVSGQVTCPA
jgi:hypothetical protein